MDKKENLCLQDNIHACKSSLQYRSLAIGQNVEPIEIRTVQKIRREAKARVKIEEDTECVGGLSDKNSRFRKESSNKPKSLYYPQISQRRSQNASSFLRANEMENKM